MALGCGRTTAETWFLTAIICGSGCCSGGLGVVLNMDLIGKPSVTEAPSLTTDTVSLPSLVITET